MAFCSTLNVLPAKTRSLLSSGQIITSVHSVVKELMENSLDAGATAIEVRLTEHGLAKIVVRDNGRGASEDAVPLMVTAHTTSKIVDFADLRRLTTYGFRGEALNALCGLAHVEIETRRECDKVGKKFVVDSSAAVVTAASVAMRPGMTVTARNLFHTVPVRRNMYKKGGRKSDELKKVEGLCRAFAIVR